MARKNSWFWRFWRFGWKRYRLQKSKTIDMKEDGYDVWIRIFPCWKLWWKTKTLSHNGRFWNGIEKEYLELREIDKLEDGYIDIFGKFQSRK